MKEESLTQFIAQKNLRLKFEELPREVVLKAKTCILDTLTSVLSGWNLSTSQAAVKGLRESGSSLGNSTVWVYGDRLNTPDVAFINTALAHSLLLEDTHIESQSHPGTISIPTAFALGEALNSSGQEILAAIVSGYEIMARIGAMILRGDFNKRGFRPSGVFGPFASCLITAKLLAMNEKQTCMALGLAANCSAGLMEFARAGTQDYCFHNAFATRNGITAALLAKHGVTAPEFIFEGETGVGNGFSGRCFNKHDLLESKNFEILKVYFKRYPACGFVQSTAQAALNAKKQYNIIADDVEEAIVKTNALGKTWPGVDYPGPYERITQAQMSNQFMVAAAFVDGFVNPENIRNYSEKRYREFGKKVRVEIDEECEKDFPEKKRVKLLVKMKNGETYVVEVEDNDYPTEAFVIERFKNIANTLMRPENIEELVELIQSFEQQQNAASRVNSLLIIENKL